MFEQKVTMLGKEFLLQSEAEPTYLELQQVGFESDVAEYELKIEMDDGAFKLIAIKWSSHMTGILSFWSPTAKRRRAVKQWFDANTNRSSIYYGAPIMSVIEQGDVNFCTVAVSDAVNPVRMTFCVNDFEEKEQLDFAVYLLEGDYIGDSYTVRFRIDERKLPYYESIAEVTTWWKTFYPTSRCETVNGELPLYSTWYSCHQHPTQESIEKELEIASKLGFKSLIIDDGWSYDGNGHGDYRDCGNWQVAEEKFPDFEGFVNKLHGLGVKTALWFPVPFVGYLSEDYQKFQGKILATSEYYQAGILDPRYPEVRKYITDAYVKMVETYDLDGLKLDFIDSFRCEEDTVACTDRSPRYDCEKVEEGVICLLREIRERLTACKPDFMIEFRQFYVGPAIVRDCNMLRVADCAFDLVTNRVGIADLRLMNYDLAVHADMLMWSKDESITNCAKMLLHILFGVPQISVSLFESSEEQKALIHKYLDYWYTNRKVLLHGTFKAHNPEACYSLLSSEDDEKRIAVAYSRNDYQFDGKATDIFNATAYDYLYIDNVSEKNAVVTSYDCMGGCVENKEMGQGVYKVTVPEGGYVNIS